MQVHLTGKTMLSILFMDDDVLKVIHPELLAQPKVPSQNMKNNNQQR